MIEIVMTAAKEREMRFLRAMDCLNLIWDCQKSWFELTESRTWHPGLRLELRLLYQVTHDYHDLIDWPTRAQLLDRMSHLRRLLGSGCPD